MQDRSAAGCFFLSFWIRDRTVRKIQLPEPGSASTGTWNALHLMLITAGSCFFLGPVGGLSSGYLGVFPFFPPAGLNSAR